MQGKGLVRFFLVVMTLVTLLQYLYILPTRKVEKKAEEFALAASKKEATKEAQQRVLKEKRVSYLDSMSTEEVFKLPFIKSYTYQDLKARQLNLGLDLKGGMSVVLQVDLREFLRALANDTKDPTFLAALDQAASAQKNAQSDFITLFGKAFAEKSDGKKLAPFFAKNDALKDKLTYQSSNGDVIRELRTKANETVDLTYKLLKERIDKLGVVQPNLSLDAARDLIVVELPGVDNPERARTFLQAAANLEFWNVYRSSDPGVVDAFVAANEKLTTLMGGAANTSRKVLRVDTTFAKDSLGNNLTEIAKLDTVYEPQANTGPLLSALTLSPPAPQAVIGMAARNKRASIDSMLRRPEVAALFPRDMKLLWSKDPIKEQATGEETDNYELYAIRMERGGSEDAPLTGEAVTTAAAQPDPQTNEIGISLKMDNAGAKKWGQLTTKAAQDNNREVAIVLDGEVVSCPRVINPITSGDTQITGNFTLDEAKDLANILQVGRLPAETKIIQEALVGPSLGKENVSKSLIALIGGFLAVILFMLLYYNSAGIVSIIALLLNVIFIFGGLASYGTVLTLPGIAGIVLTIGMSVDANVIIFERIREELRAGKSMIASIRYGYQQSYSAIIDANVTTFITCVVLIFFGIGPIKGFGVVLIIGIIFSMFTAVLVSRLIFEWWVANKGNNIKFWNGFTKNTLTAINVDWMGKRRIGYIVSGVLIVASLISIATKGFDLGVDFKGGYSYNVQFNQSKTIDAQNLRKVLSSTFQNASTVVKVVDTENTFNITTSYMINDTSDNAQEIVTQKLHEGVAKLSSVSYNDFVDTEGSGTHITSSSKVGPTIADDIKDSSFWSTTFALLGIFFYLAIRFRQWRFSLGAIIALLHDVIITLGAFSLLYGLLPFPMEVDQAFVAAILTVIGYSVNDTVIVYDRIREFMGSMNGKSTKEVFNSAINTTLSRTLFTSATTLLVVVVLLIFGGTSIKGFAFALFVGILIGTYSSVFVASAITVDLLGNKGYDLGNKTTSGGAKKSSFTRRETAKPKI